MQSAELAERLAVSRRTVFRDLKALREAGLEIHRDFQREQYRSVEGLPRFASQLTRDELLAIYILCNSLAEKDIGLPFRTSARSAMAKLVGHLPDHLRSWLHRAAEAISIQFLRDDRSGVKEADFEVIVKAIIARRCVRILVTNDMDARTERTLLSPYRVVFFNRRWNVIGRSSLHRQIRAFELCQIVSAAITDNPYAVPPRFSVQRWLAAQVFSRQSANPCAR